MIGMQGLYTDVFRKCDVLALKECDKTGDVSVVQAKEIGKRVLKVLGSVPSSNCVRVPGNKARPLNLRGDYVNNR